MQIPHKLDLHVGNLPAGVADFKMATWRRLGSMSFDSNERSKYQARELKSVQLDVTTQLLKVTLHQPHENQMNQSHQVGLKAQDMSEAD